MRNHRDWSLNQLQLLTYISAGAGAAILYAASQLDDPILTLILRVIVVLVMIPIVAFVLVKLKRR